MTTPRQTAAMVIENVPLLMRALRSKFREKGMGDLSMAEIRMLAFVDSNRGASLSEAAGHIGLSLPSMSKLADALVKQGLLTRSTHGADRRRICLGLTPTGKRQLDEAYQHTQAYFSGRLAELTNSERTQVVEAIDLLKKLFAVGAVNPAARPVTK